MGTVEEHIMELRRAKASCSQATLVGISRGIDAPFPDEKLLSAIAAGLRGGIGRTFEEGTCGAVTGGVIALGLLYPDNPEKAAELSAELFREFKKEFGTVTCGKLTPGQQKKNCNACCLTAGRCVEKLYKETL